MNVRVELQRQRHALLARHGGLSGDDPQAGRHEVLMSKFKAAFMICVDWTTGDRQPAKWRIHFSDREGFSWGCHDFSRDLGFMSKRDCEIAIANLEKHGIVDDEGIEPLTDDELMKICCEHLRW